MTMVSRFPKIKTFLTKFQGGNLYCIFFQNHFAKKIERKITTKKDEEYPPPWPYKVHISTTHGCYISFNISTVTIFPWPKV